MRVFLAAAGPFEGAPSSLGCSLQNSYQLFGLTIASDFAFKIVLPQGRGLSTLSLFSSTEPLLVRPVLPPIYVSAFLDGAGDSLTTLYREPGYEVLRFSKTADFSLSANRIGRFLPSRESDSAELRFLGPVMSYWFERQGYPTLHASAVVWDGDAIAFVSHHGNGKSGLAAALVQAGGSLLTDDLLVLEELEERWQARPSYPHLRMWQDEAEHFLGRFADLPLVQKDSEKRSVAVGAGGFGSFHDEAAPLA